MLAYVYLAVALAFAAVAGFAGFQTWRLDSCQTEHAQFVARVEAAGQAQEKESKRIEKSDRERKVNADKKAVDRRAAVASDVARLRHDSGTGSRVLPAPTAVAECVDGTKELRAEFERAWGDLVKEVRGLLDEGTKATVDLDVAKEWANGK